jgi:hypothetical protein
LCHWYLSIPAGTLLPPGADAVIARVAACASATRCGGANACRLASRALRSASSISRKIGLFPHLGPGHASGTYQGTLTRSPRRGPEPVAESLRIALQERLRRAELKGNIAMWRSTWSPTIRARG